MRRFALLLAGLLFVGAARAAAEPAATATELEAPATIHGLWLRDVDGDGASDVLLLEGRRVFVFAGRDGALPQGAPRWTAALGDDVTFVDAEPPGTGGPRLLTFGLEGAVTVALADGRRAPLPGARESLAWSDRDQANFAPLVRAGGVLLPTPTGVAWHGSGDAVVRLAVPRFREVVPAGDFLQDTAIVTEALPQIWLGRPSAGDPTLWALGGSRLRGSDGSAYDVGFLPREGTRRLDDLDGDGRPEVLHEAGDNLRRTYAFFRAPASGGDLRPPAAVLRLSGYCLDPRTLDLDGDGRRDFVVTTLPVDARNTMRALGGKVTANTKAFLHQEGARMFASTPNASIASDVGVALRFTPGGRIQVQRSLTILVDGDYDGDGRKDLLIRTGDATLTLRRGMAGRAVWEAEGREIPIPPVGASPGVEGRAADVDGDGRDEIVLLYRRPHGGRDRVRIVKP